MSRNGKPNADFVGPMKPLKGVLDAANEAAFADKLHTFGKMPVEQLAKETGRLAGDSFVRLFKEAADAIRKAAQEKVDDALAAQEKAAAFTQAMVDNARDAMTEAETYAQEIEAVGVVHADALVQVSSGISSLHALIQAERARTTRAATVLAPEAPAKDQARAEYAVDTLHN